MHMNIKSLDVGMLLVRQGLFIDLLNSNICSKGPNWCIHCKEAFTLHIIIVSIRSI